jgi:hypothetical protein
LGAFGIIIAPRIHPELEMNILSKTNLPLTLVIALILWSWLSLISALIGAVV